MSVALAAVMARTLFGCGGGYQLHTVHRVRDGGTIALRGRNMARAWQEAEQRMSAYCGGPYEIVEEKRVRVGSVVAVQERVQEDENTPSTERKMVQTEEGTYETQLTYACLRSADDPDKP